MSFPRIFLRTLLFQLALLSSFLILLLILGKTGLITANNFLNWDAQHYNSIRKEGYHDFLTAFFPLFPYAWKWSGLGALGISLMNGIIFLLAFSWLVKEFNIHKREHLLIQSFPSFIFMFLPYSEALFFLSGAMALVGIKRNQVALTCFGLLLCSLGRPATYVLVPAILVVSYYRQKDITAFLTQGILYSAILLVGLFITVCIHYRYTGQWFVFFEAQKGWNNKLQIPQIPLRSWGGNNIGRLDGTALLIGILSAAASLSWLYKRLTDKEPGQNPALLFSFLYLAGISLMILMFRGGSLFSLNRFVFATAFFLPAFAWFAEKKSFTTKQVGFIFLALSAYWLLFGSYVHIQALMKFEALTLYMLLPFLLNHSSKLLSKLAFVLFVAGNSFLQIYFMMRFLENQWVG